MRTKREKMRLKQRKTRNQPYTNTLANENNNNHCSIALKLHSHTRQDIFTASTAAKSVEQIRCVFASSRRHNCVLWQKQKQSVTAVGMVTRWLLCAAGCGSVSVYVCVSVWAIFRFHYFIVSFFLSLLIFQLLNSCRCYLFVICSSFFIFLAQSKHTFSLLC